MNSIYKMGLTAVSAICCTWFTACGDSELEYYDTGNGGFRYRVGSQMKIDEDADTLSHEEAFKCKYGTIIVGHDQGYYHVTAKGLGEESFDYYKENGYSDISSEELEFNGMPAYRINATDSEGISYSYTLIQYGNGELLSVEAESDGKIEKLLEQTDIILNSVECSDPPLKTEPETVENEYFSITAGADWYIRDYHEEDDDRYCAAVGLNLADKYADTLQKVALEAFPDESDPKAFAQKKYEKCGQSSHISSLSIEDTEILGFEAQLVSFEININKGYEYLDEFYYFENNGVCYSLHIQSSKDNAEQFYSDIQPILESIKIR
ncbi:MAG: hypothetical protein K2J37_00895 [Ruminococcus sp.]|nr:hypothetical protein [Ruminococcus sp.]MDE6784801.1 hypothetical protein [Ruminococcus sp.]